MNKTKKHLCGVLLQAFMEEMTRKQPDVDKITKTHKRKAAVESQSQSQIPVLGKGRHGSTYSKNTHAERDPRHLARC